MSRRKIDREANKWFATRLCGPMDRASEARFQAWFESSEEHRQAFARYERTWNRVMSLARRGLINRDILHQHREDTAVSVISEGDAPFTPPRWRLLCSSVAAATLAVIGRFVQVGKS